MTYGPSSASDLRLVDDLPKEHDVVGRTMKTFLARHRVDVILVLFALVTLAPIVSVDSAQPASRIALTASIAEHHTVDISGYPIGVDHALFNGHLRSDKAPGQPLLALPAYALSRWFGGESATHKRMTGNLGLWFVTLWSSLIPFAIVLVLMRRAAARYVSKASSVGVALALGYGSLLLPYSVNLFGHMMAAAFVYGAWVVLERAPRHRAALFWSGLLAGCAVSVEYQTGIIALVAFGFAAYSARAKAEWFLFGALPPALVTALYQWRAFGAPWRLPFGYFAGTINGTTEGGYTVPGLHGFELVLTGNRGLLLLSPIVIVGFVASVRAAHTPARALRRNGIAACVICSGYLLLVAGWSGTPTLETPGPRYLAPAIPFLAVPIAAAWKELRSAALLTATWGFVVQLAAATTTILIAQNMSLLPEYWHRVCTGAFTKTIWSMAFGRTGDALYLLSAAGACWLLWYTTREEPAPHASDSLQIVGVAT